MVPWVHPSSQPKHIGISIAIFAGLRAHYCDRPTDHTARSVTIRRMYVHSMAMRPNNNNNKSRFRSNYPRKLVECFSPQDLPKFGNSRQFIHNFLSICRQIKGQAVYATVNTQAVRNTKEAADVVAVSSHQTHASDQWPFSRYNNKHPFNGLLSRTTWVSRYQKGKKTFWILMKQDMMGWQWHQLEHT